MVSASEYDPGGLRSSDRNTEYKFAFQFGYCELSLKNQWGRDKKSNFVIFLVMVAWGRMPCLKLAEIAHFVSLILFRDGRRKLSPRFYFISYFKILSSSFYFWREWGLEVSSVFSCLTLGLVRKTLLRSSASCQKIENVLWKCSVGVFLDCQCVEF